MHFPHVFFLSSVYSNAFKVPYTLKLRNAEKIFFHCNKTMWKEDPSSFMKGFDLYVQFSYFLNTEHRRTWLMLFPLLCSINSHLGRFSFFSSMKVKVKSLSRAQLFATLWTVAYQAPLSMGFSRQEYWSGLPFPSPGDLPDPGIEPRSTTLQADALTSEPPGKLYELLLVLWGRLQSRVHEHYGVC